MKTKLSQFCTDTNSSTDKVGDVFARGMDDFIFITTQRSKAETFLHQMHTGFPGYNCTIQESKMATNLSVKTTGNGRPLTFCGAILHNHLGSLVCRPDFQGLYGSNIVYCSKFLMMFQNNVNEFISSKMLFVCGLYVKPLYVNVELNGKDTVIINLFEIAYINGLKLHSMLVSMYFVMKKPLPTNCTWLKTLILKMAEKFRRCYSKVVTQHNLKNESIESTLVFKISLYACQVVLKEKYSAYYTNQNLPFIKKELFIPIELKEALKERGTFKIKSYAYQKL